MLLFHLLAAYPDVLEKQITPDHEFMVIACDGIWDVLTNQEVVDFVRARIAHGMEPCTVRSDFRNCDILVINVFEFSN